jgi:RHS repeat-associated protein
MFGDLASAQADRHRGAERSAPRTRDNRDRQSIMRGCRARRRAALEPVALLLLAGVLLLLACPVRAQMADCGRWSEVRAWTGTFTMRGTGSGTSVDGWSVTVQQAIDGVLTLDQSGCPWGGSLTASARINEEHVNSCDDPSQGTATLTIRETGRTDAAPALSAVLDIRSGTYRLFGILPPETEFVETFCGGGVVKSLDLYFWGPFGNGLGGLGELPLPATGLTLSGSTRFQAPGGVDLVPMDWEITWQLSPTTDTVEETVDDPCQVAGSIIGCENQSLGESVGLVGTPFRLHYQSDRVPGRAGASGVAIAHTRHLGGWSLDVHHALDPAGPVLVLGDGGRRSAEALGTIIRTKSGDVLVAAEDGGEVYVFDSSGRHLRTLHALTGTVRYTFAYDGSGSLTAITDGNGTVTTIERDAGGAPTAIVAPFGPRTTLTLDPQGYLARLTNPAGEAVQLGYTTDGLLTSLTDPRGSVYAFSYDAEGRLLRDEDPAGGFKALVRTADDVGYTVSVGTAQGRTTSYRVENPPDGGQRRVTTFPSGLQAEWVQGADDTRTTRSPDGTLTTMARGPDPRWGIQVPIPQERTLITPGGRVSTITAKRTATLANPDDPLSLISQTNTVRINGRTYTGTYTAATRTVTGTTPEGRQATLTFDAQSRVVQAEVTGLFPVTYEYGDRGWLITVAQGTGAEVRTTRYTYLSDGTLESIVDPAGHATSFGYDAAGRVITQMSADGAVIRYTYDANGNLTTLSPPDQPAHAFSSTPVDQLSAYVPPEVGAEPTETLYTYNADRQLTHIVRPDGQGVDLGYDSAGRLGTLTQPRGERIYTYDATTGSLATINIPGGVTLSYSSDGPLLMEETWTGPVAGRVSRTYDDDLRLRTSSIAGGEPLVLQYDADGLLTQAGALTLRRNPQNGLLIGSTLGSATDAWGYNGFGESISYEAASQGTPLYHLHHTRDPLGRIIETRETIGEGTATYRYSYDAAGRLTDVQQNGVTVASYTYDPNGNRLTFTARPLTVSLNQAMLPPGDLLRVGVDVRNSGPAFAADTYVGILLPDGVNVVFLTSLAPLNWVVTRLDADPRTFPPLLANLHIPEGFAAKVPELFALPFLEGMPSGEYAVFVLFTPPGALGDGRIDAGDLQAFDSQPFSVGVMGSTASRTGFIRSLAASAALHGRYDAQDRLTGYGNATYTYASNGELQHKAIAGQTTTYDYDALGNLLAVTLPTGAQITYVVDGRNRRIGKQVDGMRVQGFLYQDRLRTIAELDGSNNVISRFVYASRANVPDYVIKGGTNYRIIADHLGSPRLVINTGTGEVVQRLDYDAFGRVLNDTNPGFQPFGFAGGLYDYDTKLTRFGARDYDAETGRWTAKDPILFAGRGANLYGYVANDPVNFSDPRGLAPGDKTFGLPKDFWKWYHRQVKRPGDPDLTKEEALEEFEEWERQQCPGPEGKSEPAAEPSPEPPVDPEAASKAAVATVGVAAGAWLVFEATIAILAFAGMLIGG